MDGAYVGDVMCLDGDRRLGMGETWLTQKGGNPRFVLVNGSFAKAALADKSEFPTFA